MADLKLDVSKRFMVLVSVVLIFGTIAGVGFAGEGHFNLPLAWVLDKDGNSVDANDDGVVDNSEKVEGLSASDLMASGTSGSSGAVSCSVICGDARLDIASQCSAPSLGYSLGVSSGIPGRCTEFAAAVEPTEIMCCYFKDDTATLPITNGKKIFVTSRGYNGDLGGEAGADTKCQERADAAGLSGTFKAWLLDGTGDSLIYDKFDDKVYINMKGQKVITTFYTYTGSASAFNFLENPINYDEYGREVTSNYNAWTGLSSAAVASQDCGNFREGAISSFGFVGQTDLLNNGDWFYANSLSCNNKNRLICVET